MSYFGSLNICPTASRVDEFRNWGKSISNMFASCSWVTESTVTNAVDWTTVSYSTGSIFIPFGFEVWKMNDGFATGSGRNVYVRIDYGSGRSPTVGYGQLAHWITVGTSCTTTGVIGSDNGGRMLFVIANNAIGVGGSMPTPQLYSYVNYVSGDSNRIGFLLAGYQMGNTGFLTNNDYSFPAYLNIERLKDASGNDIADGIHICGYPSNDSGNNSDVARNYCWNILYTGSAYGAAGIVGPETKYQTIVSTNPNYGFQIGAGLHFPIVGNALPPILGSVALSTNDATYFGNVVVPINGTNHTYLSLKGGVATRYGLSNILRTDVLREYLAMRYE